MRVNQIKEKVHFLRDCRKEMDFFSWIIPSAPHAQTVIERRPLRCMDYLFFFRKKSGTVMACCIEPSYWCIQVLNAG